MSAIERKRNAPKYFSIAILIKLHSKIRGGILIKVISAVGGDFNAVKQGGYDDVKIICIYGKAGVGKDVSAKTMKKYLEEKGKRVLITHYADLLKYVREKFLGWNGEKDTAGRSFLQNAEVNIIRRGEPDYLVDFIIDAFRVFKNEWDFAIIPDCRFPNEYEKLIREGFEAYLVAIEKMEDFHDEPTEERRKRGSENAPTGYPFDFVIHNKGKVNDLVEQTLRFVNEYMQV